MKKTRLLFAGLSILSLSSCYTSKVANGSLTIEEPTVKVNSVKNHALIYGLVPLSKGYDAKTYVGDRKNYLTKYQMSFVDGLLGAITFGIYTPTTTTFYVPIGDVKKD